MHYKDQRNLNQYRCNKLPFLMFALQLDLVNGFNFFRHKRFQKIRSVFEQAPLIYNQGKENDSIKTLRLCGDDRRKDFFSLKVGNSK